MFLLGGAFARVIAEEAGDVKVVMIPESAYKVVTPEKWGL